MRDTKVQHIHYNTYNTNTLNNWNVQMLVQKSPVCNSSSHGVWKKYIANVKKGEGAGCKNYNLCLDNKMFKIIYLNS